SAVRSSAVRVRSARSDSGPCNASSASASLRSSTVTSARACRRIHARSAAVLAALTTSRKRAGARRKITRSSSTPPRSLQRTVYCPSPSASRATSFTVSSWHSASAPAPRSSISPMWLTSKTPQRRRTAWCSSIALPYETGISQPANSTRRAPSSRCASNSGVRLAIGSHRRGALRRAHGVGEQHGDSHGADTARHGRDVARALGSGEKLDVARDLAAGAAVDSHGDHDGAGAAPAPPYQARLPGGGDQDLGPADLVREVGGTGVAHGDGGVTLEEQQCDRLADQQAPTDDDGARASQ